MPIYEYACQACGHQQEVLQKVSDAPLTNCAACGQGELQKLISSTSFQLKGSGWYVTDFRDGPNKKAQPESQEKPSKKENKDSSTSTASDATKATTKD